MGYVSLLLLGVIVLAVGIVNFRGNISTIHWYNRSKVNKDNAPKYGKSMGIGTIVIGGSIIFTAVLQMIFDAEAIFYLLIVGLIIGVAIMVHAQFKYNSGIF